MLKFNLIKVFKRTPIIVIILSTVILLVSLFGLNMKNEKKEIDNIEKELITTVDKFKKELSTLDENNEKGKFQSFEMIVNKNEKHLKGVTGTTNDYLDWVISEGLFFIKTGASGGLEFQNSGTVPAGVYIKTMEQAQIIKEKEIPPLFPINFISDFDSLGSLNDEDLSTWKEMNKKFYNKGIYYIWYLIQNNYLFYLIIIILICLFGTLSQENGKNRMHIKFYKVEGISIQKIFLTDFISKFIYAVAITLIIVLSVLLITSLFNGFGSLEYPVPVKTYSMESMTFISLKEYFIKFIILYLFSLLMILSLSSFIESFISHSLVSVLIEIIFVFIAFNFTRFAKLNPFSYLHFDSIITNGFPDSYLDLNYIFIIGYLSLVSFFFLLFGVSSFGKYFIQKIKG